MDMRSHPEVLTDDLVREMRGGSADAAGLLFHRYQRAAMAIAFSKTRDLDAAAEVVQDAWISALKQIGRLEDPRRFAAWFGTIVANLARDRARRRLTEHAARERLHREAPAAAEPRERDQRLLHSVQGLDEEGRALILLRFMGELSYSEIADTLGLPLNRVKWGIQSAFERLRRELRDVP